MNRPFRGAGEVTPDDDNTLATESSGIYVGTTGDLAVQFYDGSSVTIPDVPSGAVLDISVVKVLATGTTATGIIALY